MCIRDRLADSRDCMEELITALKEKELLSILTGKQRELIEEGGAPTMRMSLYTVFTNR